MTSKGQVTDTDREILFEFTRVGTTIRVSAIDVKSNVEVTVIGAAGVGRDALMGLAKRKLAYVMAKSRSR